MNKSLLRSLLFMINCTLSLLINQLHAQTIIREYNGTTYSDPNVVISGCGGVAVRFSISSDSAHTYSNFFWSNIENGITQTPFSNLAEPFEQFNTNGLYGMTVTFDDFDGTTTTTKTISLGPNTIEVFNQPEGTFFADHLSVCIGTTITLIQTTPGSFSQLSFLIDNKLYPIDHTNPLTPVSVTLNTPGDYDVTLSGTTSDGCQFIKRQNAYIHVEKPYTTSFTATQTLSCNTTQNITFTASSTDIDGGVVSPIYYWDFGDGTLDTTSINTTTHTFDNSLGNDFTVDVNAISNNCMGTTNNTIDVHFRDISTLYGTPTVSGDCDEHILTYSPNTIDPLLVGMNITWDFGDGSTPTVHGIGDVVSHTFSNSTPNPITTNISATLNGVTDNSCSFSDTKVIPILPQAGIAISSNNLEYCSANFNVIVEAINLQNVSNFYWVLDGDNLNPIGNNEVIDTIVVSGFGTHSIELYFDAQTGDPSDNCSINNINVHSAPLDVTIAGASFACEPSNDAFSSSTIWTNQAGNPITNPFPVDTEEWRVINLGTNDTTYYTSDPLVFSSLGHGDYNINYIVTLVSIGNNTQCSYSSPDYLYEVGEIFDNPTLNYSPSTICIGSTVNFTTTTTADTVGLGLSGDYPVIYQYRYTNNLDWTYVGESGNGTFYYGDLIENSRTSLPSVFQVQLRAVINNCAGNPTTINITIEPSEAEHDINVDECNPTILNFTNNSIGTVDTDYQWTLTIDPPSSAPITWSSDISKDENHNFLAESDFPIFIGYTQGEIPENSRVDIRIEAIESGNGCSDTEDTTIWMPGPVPQLAPTPSTGTCVNTNLQLDAGDGNVGSLYNWTFTHNVDSLITYSFSSNTSIVNTTFPIPGEYTGSVMTISSGGCTLNDSVGPILITGGSVSIDGPVDGCIDDTFSFQGINLMYNPNTPIYIWKVDGITRAVGTATGGVIPDLTGVTFSTVNSPQSTPHTISLELTVNSCTSEYSHDIIVTEPDFNFPLPHSDYISFDYDCDEIVTVVDLDLDDNEVYNLGNSTITYSIGGVQLTPISQNLDEARLSIPEGSYSMVVNVEDELGCSDSNSLTFTVPIMRELEADFTTNTQNLVCPGFISFGDSLFETSGHSTRRQALDNTNTLYDIDISSWDWDFDGDGIVDATTTQGDVAHYYDRPGRFKAVVTITDAQGCQDTSDSVTIVVGGTSGSYEILKKIGFEPASPVMVAYPVVDPDTDITNTIYQWSSGNGQLGVDSVQLFTYDSTISGTNISTITPNLTFLDENGCSYPADWSGDFSILNCPEISNPDITLCTDNGPYTLNVSDMSWEGAFNLTDTIETADYIYRWELQYRWFVDGTPISQVNGGHDPEVTFNFGSAVTNPFIIDPNDADGKLYTIQATIIASYIDKNDASNNNLNQPECMMTDNIRVIYNPTPVAAFTNTEVCGNTPTTLDASMTAFGIYTRGVISNYEWDIDNDGIFDLSTTSSVTNYTFPSQGAYPVTLRVTSSDGCIHQSTKDSVIVNSVPVGDFSYQNVCQSFGIQFNDQSSIIPVTDDKIVRWDWDFNNNGTYDIGGTDTLLHRFPLVSFDTLRDNYNTGAVIGTNLVLRPRLTVTTNKGCTFDFMPSTDSVLVFSFKEPTTVLEAERQSDALSNETCLGQTMQFRDLSTVDNSNIQGYINANILPVDVNDITEWVWDLGDGTYKFTPNPTHVYTSAGTYTVKLLVTTARGCSRLNSIAVNIRENPDPEIGVDSLIVCDDQTVHLRPVADDSTNFAYTWTAITGPTNGTIMTSGLNTHTGTVNVDESNFNNGESIIDVKYQLQIIDNNHPTSCTTLDTVDVQFHRFPNINFDTTLFACDTSAYYEALPFGTETINGFSYTWTQAYLKGGSVIESDTSSQDFLIKPNVFDNGSTIISAKYYIDVTNTIGCTDRDSIEFEFYRKPDFTDKVEEYPICNNADRSLYDFKISPFGKTEGLPHNNAYNYIWSMSSDNLDHNIDPAFLSDIRNQVITYTNVQNLSLNILEDYFKDDSLNLWFELDLKVENSFDNTCFKDTSFIIKIERRPSDFTLNDTRIDPCNLNVTLNHHTEDLLFNYRWKATSVSSSYNGATIPDTYNQTRTLNFTDTNFATGESQFTVVMNNRVRKRNVNNGSDASPQCEINRNVTLQFYRTPDINFTETWPSGNNCSSQVLLSSGAESITGFNYNWVQTNVSNGTVSHDATNNKDINLSVASWATGQTVISVTYELTVENSASTTCMDVESYTIEFHRTPEVTYNPTALNCSLIDTVTAKSEALSSATFTWIENTVSGGNLNTTDNGNEFIIEVDNFGANDHRIDANYTVNIANATASNCDNDTTFDIVFYRTPDIVFTDTRTDSCSLTNTFKPFGTSTINGYNYQWRELYVKGGTINTNSLTDQNLTFDVTSFDQDTAYIDIAYELYVENSDATGCIDIDTVIFKFYRTPNLNVFRKLKPSDECGLSVELYPLDTTEIINHTEGFDYTWTLDPATIVGTPSNVLPASILTDINNKKNNQNFDLTIPLSAFDIGSNEIQFELDLNIIHSASGVNCSKDSTLLLSFKRPPVINMVEVKADSCALSTTLKPFGTETITGFNYDWEVISISNYTNTTYAVGETFNTQNFNVNLVDSDFTPTEAKITMIVALEVQNQLASTDPSCIDTITDTLIFYRTPEITLPFLSTKANTCDHFATSEPFTINVNGYSYVWSKVSESDGAVTNSSLTNRQITVSLDTFATNSLQVDAQYQLRVFNTEYPDCYDEEVVDFEFFRTPEINFETPQSYCASIDSSMTFRSTNEAFIFNGANFFWNLNNINGGSIDSTASGTNTFTIDVASFDTDAAQIDAVYTVSITNPSTHTCDDDTTFQVTFFRTPEINFASTKTDSCALVDIIQPFNGEDIPLFTRNWRQLSVTGGTIKENSTNTDLDLNISVNSFDLHSTTIAVQYELTATNSVSTSCVDIDTVAFYFYRTPDFTNLDEQQPLGLCGGLINVFPLGETEVINHNNGFDYQWILDSTPGTITGAGVDGSTLSTDILNYISTNVNSQNFSTQVKDDDYENGAHILKFNMDLDISHTNTNINCASTSRNILFQYYRFPDIDIHEVKTDSCDLTSTLQPFGNEIISGFNYNWEIQNITGYDGSSYAVNDTYNTQNTTFTVTDDDFIDTESVISITIELTAINSAAPADISCQNTKTYTLYFYRTPEIKANFFSTKLYACDDEGIASPFDTHINGFVYQWTLDSMSTKNGEVTGVVIDDSHLGNRELNVQIDSFTDYHSIMRAHYKLRVINSNQSTCYDEDTVSFIFYRTPEVSLTSLTGACQNAVMVTSTNEMLLDIDFDWSLISESGGTVVTNPTNHDGNRSITFTAVDYDLGDSEINSTYMITLLNSGESMCDDDTTFSFTLYRQPEIDLKYSRATSDSCSNALTISPFANESIAGFTNSWTEVSRSGGAITTSTNTYNEDLTITLDTFNINSTRIDTRYLFDAYNTHSTACVDSMSIVTTLYRQADFTNFTETRLNGNCGLEMTLSPLGLTEVIPHNGGFDYKWSYDSLNITGVDNNKLPSSVINSFYSQLNNQNLSLTLPLSAFADGSNKIEIPVTIAIENTDQNSCINSYDHTMVFYRTPVIDIQQSLTGCGVNNLITSFGNENLSSAFTFAWSFTPTGGSVTNSSLTGQDLNFTNPIFSTGSDTIRIDVSLNVSNNENTTCQADTSFTFLFYKEPVISFTQSLSNCDSINLIKSLGTEILSGFSYTWEQLKLSGGQLNISSPYSLNTQDIQLEKALFDLGSHRIDADYKLTVSNSDTTGAALCSDLDSTSFTILRVPSIAIQQSLADGDCGNSNSVTTFGSETISGFIFEWTSQSINGGAITISSTSTQNVIFSDPIFDTSSNRIDVVYNVVARNSVNPNTCFDIETVRFTFYKYPEIDLKYSRATSDSCSNALTISPFANESIAGFTNSWTEVSRSGGAITTSTNTYNEDLTITLDTFNINSTRIDTRYLFDAYNTHSTACVDSMSIVTTLYRQADFTNFTETRLNGNCGLEMTLSPLGLTEVIPHNGGFDYKWSYDSLNITGVDNDKLPSSIINSFYSQLNNQNLSLTLPLSAFAKGSNKIEIPVTIAIENTDQNSCINSYDHTMVFYRTPVVDIQQSLTGCGVNNLITSFGNENLSSAFTFAWSFTPTGGSVTNSSLTGQDLNFTNPIFSTGSDTIRIDVSLNVRNNENTTCQADTSFTFLFYKEPVISFTQSLSNCDSINLIKSLGTEILSGFSYTWEQLKLSGGQLNISSPYSLTTQDIQLEKALFDLGSHRIDADYKLTVSNSDTTGAALCSDIDSTSFTILRVPSIAIQQSLADGDCGNSNSVTTFGSETISGFIFEWTSQSVNGGAITISSTSTQNVIFSDPIFDTSSNRIDVVYNVVARNSVNPNTCFDVETVKFTFYRTPDAMITPILPVCSSSSILLTTTESYVTNFDYLWTLLKTTTDNNPNSETLVAPTVVQNDNTFTLNSPVDIEGFFPTGSSEITYKYEVSIENSQSPGCTDKDTIEATFFRVPLLKSTQSLDNTNCESVNIIRPFGTENIPNYTYNWSEITVNGGTVQVSYLDPQNQNIQFIVDKFDSLSHRIDVSYRVIVMNNSGACTGNETFNFTFFRTPKVDLARLNLSPVCRESSVILSPSDTENAGFNYQWTPLSVNTDNGLDLLASNIKPLESSLTDHTLVLNHNPSFPQSSVRVTAVYELEVSNADNSCTTTEQITVTFDRDALLSLNANNFSTCDNNNLTLSTIEPRTDNYVYTWSIDNIYTDNNASITNLSNVNTSTAGSITVDPDIVDFPYGSTLITAKYDVHAENQLNADCDADTSYTITLARKPRINFTDNHSGCALDTVLIKSLGEEIINGFNYTWSIVNIDGYNGNSSTLLSHQKTHQNIEIHFDDSDFSNGRSQIEITFELNIENPNESGCNDTQQHTLVFFRIPEIDLIATKIGNDSCANEITISPFNEVVNDYQYQWSQLSNVNGTATMVNANTRDLTVNAPIFDNGETQIDLHYQLEISNMNPSANQPCITTEEITISFFKTPTLRNDLLTENIYCNLNASLKGLQSVIDQSHSDNYRFDWSLSNLNGGTIDTLSVLDSLHINALNFDLGSGEINFNVHLNAHNAYQFNSCFANKDRAITFYRIPVVNLVSSANDLCETDQFTITTGEELVSHFDYNWSINITDDINNNTGNVDTTSNGARGHELVVSNPTFPVGASYIDIEATLLVSNGISGCTDTETTTIRFHKQPIVNLTRSSASACDDSSIKLKPQQNEVVNFIYTWERLSITTDTQSPSGSDIIVSSTSDYEITVDTPTFPNAAAEISAWYKLTVSNPDNPYCTIVSDSIEVTFYRSPITNLGADYQVQCDSSEHLLIPSNEENIPNFNYNWVTTSIYSDKRNTDSNAQVNIIDNSTYSPTLEVITIPSDASFITTTVQLTTTNNLNSCGVNIDEKTITFLRKPEVTLPDDMADCQDRVFFLSPNEDEWTGMDYEWEVTQSNGGYIASEQNMSSYLASLSNPIFSSNSFEIKSKVVLRVKNKLDQSCIAIDTMNIVFHKTPEANFTVDKGFGCQNEIVYFSTRNSDAPHSGSIYEWDFDNDGIFETQTQGDTTYVFNQIGTHSVSMRIITPAGCISPTFTENVPIYEVPTPSFTVNDICIGETAQIINTTPQLSNSGNHGIRNVKWDYDYNENNGALFDVFDINASYQYPEAGTFKILIEVTNNGGCTNTYIDSVTVTPLPVITLASEVWICEGLTTTLSPEVNVPVTYSWSTGQTTNEITVGPLEETTYSVTVTNEQGCTNMHYIIVHVIPDLNDEFYFESCDDNPITLDAQIPNYNGVVQTFEWSTGETTPTIDVLQDGTYTVRTMVEHESGTMCEFNHEFTTKFYPNPERALEDTTFCFEFGDLLQISATEGENFTYQWDNGETSRVITKDKPGTFTVLITDETHATRCTTIDTIFINQICPARLHTPNAFTPNGDGINDEFLLEPAYAINIDLHIFNNWGESIFHKFYKTSFDANETGNGWDGFYKGEEMTSGNYTYTIRYTSEKDGSVTEKTGHILLIR